ncbi:hypothetical protein NKG94_27835 [Micromonospora sp. M12]
MAPDGIASRHHVRRCVRPPSLEDRHGPLTIHPSAPPRVLGIPALVVAALTVVARPTPASAAPKAECLADLLRDA